ncbi:hypothetical protein CDD83_5792 [Cordyceps sp. RAO-2017]|nr:hypothetical protein CDD83_5792 [Cordyceps sp. RAO-2017]
MDDALHVGLLPSASAAVLFKLHVDSSEAVLRKSPMVSVARRDIGTRRATSGCSGVVRIFVKNLWQQYHHFAGTGALITRQFVVTAGHVLVGASRTASEVMVRAGTERRQGSYFIVDQAWNDHRAESSDMAFIFLLSFELDAASPLGYKTMPATDNMSVILYGYPCWRIWYTLGPLAGPIHPGLSPGPKQSLRPLRTKSARAYAEA